MGSISITCPTTGELVSPGMTMERESVYRSVLTGNSVKCPHCAVTHIWSKADANFDESRYAGPTADRARSLRTTRRSKDRPKRHR